MIVLKKRDGFQLIQAEKISTYRIRYPYLRLRNTETNKEVSISLPAWGEFPYRQVVFTIVIPESVEIGEYEYFLMADEKVYSSGILKIEPEVEEEETTYNKYITYGEY